MSDERFQELKQKYRIGDYKPPSWKSVRELLEEIERLRFYERIMACGHEGHFEYPNGCHACDRTTENVDNLRQIENLQRQIVAQHG